MELRDAADDDLAGLVAVYNDVIARPRACARSVTSSTWLDLVFLQRRIGA